MNMQMVRTTFVASSLAFRRGLFAGCRRAVSSSFPALASSPDSSFNPPVPPTSKGVPVYPDIDFSVAEDSESISYKRNRDRDAVYVVNGSSRGIGLQFVKSLLERCGGKVVACCRSPDASPALQDFLSSAEPKHSARVTVLPLDVQDQSSIAELARAIEQKYNRVDVLLNVAGILGDGLTTPGPERSLSKVDRSWAERSMAINTIGPVMVSQALAPMMRSKPGGRRRRMPSGGGGDEAAPPPVPDLRAATVIANLSARVGSVSDNELGGWITYRMSKSALNQATRTMSHELKRQGTWTVALHPGTTDTDLSKPFQRNVAEGRLFPVDFTVKQLLDVIDSLGEEHSGGLYDWSGKALPF